DIKRYNKSLAITETGFATELRFLNKIVIKREHEQMKFINKTFSSITSIACEIPVMFIVWYMLWDEDPMSCEPFSGLGWCGWGVLRTDFSKKPGWFVLKKEFEFLNS
ncbi:MAG: hypothetical protein QXF79_02820, partial [Ignisphaera sp.]